MTSQINVGPSSYGWGDDEVAEAVRSNPLWYHTMELRPGIVTPGWFDLRSVMNRMPWPDVRGRRCLDIGTYDGFLAFELERRGASEVVATDIASHDLWDWPHELRSRGLEFMDEFSGPKGRGFEVASRAYSSSVRREEISVYDLTPECVGMFDVVVCGTLMLHLRDPFRALAAIHSVCAGVLLSAEQIELGLTLAHRRTPITSLEHIREVQWHVPNLAGHRQMIEASGFDIEQAPRPYSVPLGVAHPPSAAGPLRRLVCRLATGRYGIPHSAVLARPRSVGDVR
jgi:tRNA (mo5U34)-methyltransferase